MSHRWSLFRFRFWLGLGLGLLFLVFAGPSAVRADEGHVPVVFEGRAGAVKARVVVRAPPVIPGLADISVRVLEGDVREVTVAPIKWNTGKKGAPRPDVARPVSGEPGWYAAELWFMESGAHVVEVLLKGPNATEKVLVPVNALATRVLGLPPWLTAMLVVLGTALVALLTGIIGAAVRESVLPPGEVPLRRRVGLARLAMALALLVSLGLATGGWKWWQAEAAGYRNNRLHRPRPLAVSVVTHAEPNRIELSLAGRDMDRMPPLLPDHGRLMHAFLLREPGLDAFAHLHPARSNRLSFSSALPALPAGAYSVYAQITYETGLAETRTNRIELPGPRPTSDSSRPSPLDPDDAWTTQGPGPGTRRDLGDDLSMDWLGPTNVALGAAVNLKVRVGEGADGKPVELESYLGMRGHLVLRSTDGRVFSHLHPGGNYAMAAQQVFELRDGTTDPVRLQPGALDPSCQLPSLAESEATWAARTPPEGAGLLSFPFEFNRPGVYRVWVQVRVRGRVRTGVYEVRVGK